MEKPLKQGDLCEIIDTYNKFAEYRGMECTVLSIAHFDEEQYYNIKMKGSDETWLIGRSCLKLIEPPKNAKDEEAFRVFMDKVLFPVPVLEEV